MTATDTSLPAGKTRLVRADGTIQAGPDESDLNAVLSQPHPFWLDLADLTPEQGDWLGRVMGVHPLVVEDAEQFGELPKIDVFDDYIAVVIYGPGRDASLDQLTPPGGTATPASRSCRPRSCGTRAAAS